MNVLALCAFISDRLADDEKHADRIERSDVERFGAVPVYRNVPGASSRTRREVAAKRLMLTNFRCLLESEDTHTNPTQHALAHMMKVGVIIAIASVYEDHPDFRPEWKVPLDQFESDARAHAFLRQQRMHALRAAEATRAPRLWLS